MSDSAEGSLFSHLEALRSALWWSVAATALFLLPGFFAAPAVLDLLIRLVCPENFTLHYFTPMEPLIVQLKIGLFLAMLAASPVILWQAGRFIAPALYRHERKAAFQLLSIAVLLFLAGMAMSLFGVTPFLVRFSLEMARESLTPIIGYAHFVNLVTLLCLSFGLMFQLPLLLIILVRAGVVEVGTLRKSRPVAVLLIFILAAILTPPDIVSQLMLGIPSWLLFELALLVAGRGKPQATESETEPESPVPDEQEEEKVAMDDIYETTYRRKSRKKRRIGAINAVYRRKRGD